MAKSKRYKLSPHDGLKNTRDAMLIAIGGVLPQILDILTTIDFGPYTTAVSITCSMLMPLVNRFVRNR